MSNIYPGGDAQYSTNLGLALWGADEVTTENFLLIDAFAGGPFGTSVNVNGVPVPSPNFISSATVVFSVVGSNISATAAGGGAVTSVFGRTGAVVAQASDYAAFYLPASTVLPTSFSAVAHEWINSYSAVTGAFAATQPSASDLTNGVTGTGAVVLASAISGFGSGTVTSFSSGSLSPLFTTSVATASSTPALSFSLSNAAQNSVFAGPATGGPGAPTFRALVAADIPALPYGTGTVTNVSFTGGLISVATSTTTPALTVAGTSGGIPYFSSASTWATSAVLPAGDFVLGGGAGSAPTASFSIVPIANGGTGAATTSQNFVFAGPTSGAGAPSFRALVAADLPSGTGTVTSVSFTGGLVSVATPTTTPAFTVAGTSGGIPYFSSTTTWATSAVLASTGVVLGGGAATAPLTSTQLTFVAPTLTVGLAGTSSGILALTGVTSGSATFTAPAVAGTTTNPVVSSNYITAPVFNATTGFTIGGAAASGNVLVGNGTDFVSTSASGLGVSWSSLISATTNLTLTNLGFTTTFNQTSAVAWLWANTTTGTASSTNASPLLELSAQYYTGAATGTDLWTLGSSLAAGTNGVSKASFVHTGSTGNAYVVMPNIQLNASAASGSIDLNNNGGTVFFSQQNGTSNAGSIIWGAGPGAWGLFNQGNASTLFLEGRMAAATTPVISFGNALSQTATSGTMIGLDIGGGTAGIGGTIGFTFNPASGTGVYIGTRIAPTIEGTTSGATTALLVNPTYTLTGLTGTNSLLDLQASSVSKFRVNTSGAVTVAAGNAATKNGVAATISTSIKTAQTAAQSAVSLVTSTPAVGMWRISFVANITTAGTTSTLGGTTGFQITFTNGNGDAVSKTSNPTTPTISAANTTGTSISGDLYCYAASASAITYSFGYTSTGTAMAYDLAVYAEFLG